MLITRCSVQFSVRIGLRRVSGVWSWANGVAVTTSHWRDRHPWDDRECVESRSADHFLERDSLKCENKEPVACLKLGLLIIITVPYNQTLQK